LQIRLLHLLKSRFPLNDLGALHGRQFELISIDTCLALLARTSPRLPENISLLKLPAYSPEINPVENVWEYLRQNRLSNRVFESYDAIVNACSDAWNALTAEPGRIRSIATRPWASVTV
jgi:hypothetical protein